MGAQCPLFQLKDKSWQNHMTLVNSENQSPKPFRAWALVSTIQLIGSQQATTH